MAVSLQGVQLQLGRASSLPCLWIGELGDSGTNGGRIIPRPTANNGAGEERLTQRHCIGAVENGVCDLGFVCEIPS